jgi:hypothetical protein
MSSQPAPLTELELRQALRVYLSHAHDDSIQVLEEMRIENGAARIDMAVIADSICGYEIKSDFDNTSRLFNQIHSYNRTFDLIYIVTGPESAKMLNGCLPSWWGVLHGERDEEGAVHLKELKQPAPNSSRDPFSLLMLLKREELNDLAKHQQLSPKTIKGTKFNLLDSMASSIPLDEISHFVTHQLKVRSTPSTA